MSAVLLRAGIALEIVRERPVELFLLGLDALMLGTSAEVERTRGVARTEGAASSTPLRAGRTEVR